MKKRLLSFALAAALALTLVPAAHAAVFSDVTDTEVARNVEVLRLMGMIEGDGTGAFRPNGQLTRAEFCKMVIVLQGREGQVVSNRSRTVFPDVRASHWAAGYVNLAATPESKDATALMHGFPDGNFLPEKPISYGEAVTVLMRALGYDDKDSGAIWPQGYLNLAVSAGLISGPALDGNGAITRAQAAKLFVGALGAKTKSGGTLKSFHEVGEVTLLTIDLAKGTMRVTDGKTAPREIEMARPVSSTALNGLKGRVILDGNKKALTFLPTARTSGSAGVVVDGTLGDAAVIVASNGSTAGFDALTGYTKGYTIYRNGVKIDARELRQYDVATYSAASNAVLVCDTRVQVYYESCQPSPSAPLSVTVLGGTTLSVLPTAQQSVAAFKPGQVMLLLLTADGRVGGAISTDEYGVNGNALCYVDGSGKVTMFCGTSLLPIAHTDADMAGQVVRISQTKPLPTDKSDCVVLSRQHNTGRGVLDVIEGKLGGTKVATDALILKDGVLTSLSELNVNRVEPRQIAYSRINSAGEVDLIVLGDTSTETIGRVVIWSEVEGERENRKTIDYMSLQYPGGETKPSRFVYSAQTGDFGVTQINSQDNFYNFTLLRKLSKVGSSAWVGTGALNYNGQTYPVATDVMCYNRDSGRWFSSLTEALDYGGTLNAYVLDGVVRAIDVGT